MSDQNEWPKPGETNPGNDASAREQAPSSAAQPGSGGPQQYGASAPEAPSAAPTDPWAQSGQGAAAQGVSEGHTAPQNPYGAPQNPYAAPQNPYAAPQNPYAAPGQTGYGAPQNPYAAPQGPNGNPYGAQGGSNPYAAPQNPYAAPAGYASAGYQPYAQRPKTNVLAILSIIFAFGGVIIWPLIILTSPAGAIMGHIALGKIKQSGEGGRGLALAGVIGGWIMTGLFILFVGAFVIFGIIAGTHGGYSDYDSGYDSGAFIG
ncbi:DUF4190 domain-containing protein [Curtobacterium sp. 22159]|uniref:DUF4190 domain-containing protein n=1 Tax=Curtobacterium sp. 22159 TaxID=3453882 RepID=UPI003F85CE0A